MLLRVQSRCVLTWLGMLTLTAASCSPAKRPESNVDSSPSTAGAADDRTGIDSLEQAARALARTSGCDSVSGCRTAPLGWRGCGGPRDYLAYCAASTDTTALFAALERLRRAEMAYNEKSGMISTCEMRMPPSVSLNAGRCTTAR